MTEHVEKSKRHQEPEERWWYNIEKAHEEQVESRSESLFLARVLGRAGRAESCWGAALDACCVVNGLFSFKWNFYQVQRAIRRQQQFGLYTCSFPISSSKGIINWTHTEGWPVPRSLEDNLVALWSSPSELVVIPMMFERKTCLNSTMYIFLSWVNFTNFINKHY